MKKNVFGIILIIISAVLVIISIATTKRTGKNAFNCTLSDINPYLNIPSQYDPIAGWKDTIKIKTIQLSDSPGYVDIYDNTIIYTDKKHLYTKTGMTTKKILDLDSYITSAKGYGNYIAWLQRCNDEKGFPSDFHDVYVFNLKTGRKETITPCPSSYIRSNLAICGNYLLCNENLIGERVKRIIVFNLKDNSVQEFKNSYSSFNDSDIYKDEIVFVKQEAYDNHLGYCSIILRNLKNNVETIIAAGLKTASSPKENRYYIVWMGRKGINYRISVYNRKTRKISNIPLPTHLKINELVLHKDKNLFFINGKKMTYIYNLDNNKWSLVKSNPAIVRGLAVFGNTMAWSTEKGLYYARIKL